MEPCHTEKGVDLVGAEMVPGKSESEARTPVCVSTRGARIPQPRGAFQAALPLIP